MAGDSAGLAIRVLNEWYLHIDPSKDEVIALRQLAETEEQQSMPLDQLAHLVLLREMAKSRASA